MTADRRGDYLQDVSIDLFRYRSVEVRAGRIQPRGVRPGGVRAGERTGGACGEPIPTMSRNCPVISPGIGIFSIGGAAEGVSTSFQERLSRVGSGGAALLLACWSTTPAAQNFSSGSGIFAAKGREGSYCR